MAKNTKDDPLYGGGLKIRGKSKAEKDAAKKAKEKKAKAKKGRRK